MRSLIVPWKLEPTWKRTTSPRSFLLFHSSESIDFLWRFCFALETCHTERYASFWVAVLQCESCFYNELVDVGKALWVGLPKVWSLSSQLQVESSWIQILADDIGILHASAENHPHCKDSNSWRICRCCTSLLQRPATPVWIFTRLSTVLLIKTIVLDWWETLRLLDTYDYLTCVRRDIGLYCACRAADSIIHIASKNPSVTNLDSCVLFSIWWS